MFDLGYWILPPDPQPNRISGVGRMRIRGRDKTPANPDRTTFNHDIRANAKGYEYYCYMLLRHQNQRR